MYLRIPQAAQNDVIRRVNGRHSIKRVPWAKVVERGVNFSHELHLIRLHTVDIFAIHFIIRLASVPWSSQLHGRFYITAANLLFSSAFRRATGTPLRSLLALPLAVTNPQTPTGQSLPSQARTMHSRVAIIGSGPAGHTAAIYAARADLAPTMYEGFLALGIAAGGQLTTTDEVENYPGFEKIQGATLMDNMRKQSEACGTKIITQTIGKVDLSSRPFKMWLHPMGDEESLEEETHTADALIIATGAKARRLGLDGEEQFWGNGVSACAVCDGSLPIFRNKPLVVIGGGDSAVEEAIYLTKKAEKVTVLVRKGNLRASKANARRLSTHPKVDIRYDTVATKITGEDKPRGLMTGLEIKNVKTGASERLDANGLFYAVGHEPATTLFKDQLKMDEDGYLITNAADTTTDVPGVFAAGDVQDKKYRQAITSAGKSRLLCERSRVRDC